MKYYLIIKTNLEESCVSYLNLGEVGIYYDTKKQAKRMARLARKAPHTLNVYISKVK